MNTENEDDLAICLARIVYPDQQIVSAMLDEDGMLHTQLKLNKPISYVQFTSEVRDETI